MSARSLNAEDRPLLDRLIDADPFKPYRQYRLLSRRVQSEIARAMAARGLDADSRFDRVHGADQQAVIVLARPLAWDTAFFGVSMAKIDHVLRGAAAGTAQVSEAVAAALNRCREAGVRHVAARVDVADLDVAGALEANGFRLMDGIATYISHPRRPAPRHVKDVGLVRPFVRDDTPQVLEITREAYRGYRGRFQLDPHLPRERADALYVEWARQCCEGRMADRVYVADDGRGGLRGWASVRRVEPLSSMSGKVVFAGSLGACRSDHPGAYASLIGTAARDNHAVGALTEAQTQNHNFAMIRVLEAVGAEHVRAEYTFHAWLG